METRFLQISCLVILGLFYGCYFFKMLKQRQQGLQTNQLGKGKKGFVRFVERSVQIASYVTPLAEIISIALATTALPTPVRIFGLLLGLTGVVVFICAVRTMRDSWRAGVPDTDKTELVTNGIFRISRNPAFLGFYLMYIGILLVFFNWVLLVVSLLTMLFFHLQIVNVEEDFLSEAFGQDYLNYKKRVNRYLGRKRSE